MQETTIFREFGPLSGSTMRLSYEVAPKIGGMLSRQTFDGDARKYFRLGATGLLALRARGFKSWGDSPDYTYFGGNSELRGYEYLSFVGQNAFFANAELRFPLIDAMATPIGVLGGVRATLFAGVGGAYFEGTPFKVFTNDTSIERPIVGYNNLTQAADLRRAACSIERLPPGRRARLLRHQPLDLRARLPGPLRLVVADADEQGLGRRRLRAGRAAATTFRKAEVHDVDWLRLVDQGSGIRASGIRDRGIRDSGIGLNV